MDDQEPESHDPAWTLLGKARPVEVRPQFSRQVLEAVRHTAEKQIGRWAWVHALWIPAARPVWLAATAAVVVTGLWMTRPPTGSRVAVASAPAATADDPEDELADDIASDLAMIDEVDDLLAPESAQDLGEEDVERLLF